MIGIDRYDSDSPEITPRVKIPCHTLGLGAKMAQILAQNEPNSVCPMVMLDSKSVKGIESMIFGLNEAS